MAVLLQNIFFSASGGFHGLRPERKEVMIRMETRTWKRSGLGWPTAILLALIVLLLVLAGSGVGFGQTTTQYLPGMFAGGYTAGSHRFNDRFVISNIGNSIQSVTLRFFNDNGTPRALALAESRNTLPPEQAVWTIAVAGNSQKTLFVVSDLPAIIIFWTKLELSTGDGSLRVQGRYELLDSNQLIRSFAPFYAEDAVLGREFTYPGLVLGRTGAIAQRVFAPLVANPGTVTVNCDSRILRPGPTAGSWEQISTATSFSIIPNGQFFGIFDAAEPIDNGKMEIVCSGNVVTAGVPFLNEFFSVERPQKGVNHPNIVPFGMIESPREGSVVQTSNVATSGWVADDDVVDVKVSLNNGPLAPMTMNGTREDVLAAFPQAKVANGVRHTFLGLGSGIYNERWVLTDLMGVVTTLTRNFRVSIPGITPLTGTYLGDVDLANSLPSGKILGGRFRLEVTQQGSSLFAARLDIYELRLVCENGEGLTSFNIIPITGGGVEITNSSFTYTQGSSVPGCIMSASGVVVSQNTIDLRYQSTAACLNNQSALQSVKPCPSIDLQARLVR